MFTVCPENRRELYFYFHFQRFTKDTTSFVIQLSIVLCIREVLFGKNNHSVGKLNTGRERLIRSHSSARFCFELSGNSN